VVKLRLHENLAAKLAAEAMIRNAEGDDDARALAGYYGARAGEYEDVYAKPERQADLARLRSLIPDYFRERHVLEVACGTGFWTLLLAGSAASVTATDVGEEVLAIARTKPRPAGGSPLEFRRADAFDLRGVPGAFDAAFAGFWLSHVSRADVGRFLCGLHDRLGAGARVMLLDNRYVEGSSTPIARADAVGNTYQRRALASGAEYEVLKNFATPDELREWIVAAGADSIDIVELAYYWYTTYNVG
jgi:2-polyprenyl-3-methyl-5-hydroxy-6-metoxy-1,4-benzoquinol methylase